MMSITGKTTCPQATIELRQDTFFHVEIRIINEPKTIKSKNINALSRRVTSRFDDYVKLNPIIPAEATSSVSNIKNPEQLVNTISSYLILKIEEKQKLLINSNLKEKLDKILLFLENEIGVLEVEKKIKEFISSGIEWIPRNKVVLNKEKTKSVLSFLETLEDDDDIQHVYANLETDNNFLRENINE